jgi:hypothetical protein
MHSRHNPLPTSVAGPVSPDLLAPPFACTASSEGEGS